MAVAAGTGEVLMSRLREGRANTPTSCVRRWGGALRRGQGTTHRLLRPHCRCRLPGNGVRFSITIPPACGTIEAIPEEDWTPIPYWMDGAADVAETTYTPFQTKPDAPPARLIVRRVKPTPGSQLALFARYSYHAFITDRDARRRWNWRPIIAATPRSRSSTASG